MPTKEAQQRNKEFATERSRKISKDLRNIGPPLPCVDPLRRAEAGKCTQAFCEIYLSSVFTLAWNPDQLTVLQRTDEVIRTGEKQAFAMPRGGGKTSICEAACLRASLFGMVEFLIMLAVSATKAADIIESIKTQLVTNDLLMEDFPEICHPIRALEDRANKAKGQHIDGQSTHILWSKNRIAFPAVLDERGEWYPNSGVIIRGSGLTSGDIRGPKWTRKHDGRTVRPGLALIDDPQDDECAHSPLQCQKLHSIVHAAVLGMAGPGKKIAAMMPGTVIAKNDFMERMLNRQLSPMWFGQRFKLINRMPDAMEKWEEYAQLRNDDFRNGGNGLGATAFYGQNREEMDRGAMVAWPERFKPDEIGPVQHAMNLLFLDAASFYSEYQNDPMPEDEAAGQLKADLVAARVVNIERGAVPLQAEKLVAAVDVQQNVLYYAIASFQAGLGGHVVDYGTWPDQGRRYFKLTEVQHTIARAMQAAGVPAGTLEGQHKYALDALSEKLLDLSYPVQPEGTKKIERLIVDAGNWGDVVKTWCLTTRHAAIVTPWIGRAAKANQKPWSEYPTKPGETKGFHWILTYGTGKTRIVKHLLGDSYYWKSLLARRLQMATGDKSAVTLFGKKGHDHRMFAEHLCAEYFQRVEVEGNAVDEWQIRAEHGDNHWFDCIVMAMAGASFAGLTIGEAQPKRQPVKVYDIEEEYRKAQGR